MASGVLRKLLLAIPSESCSVRVAPALPPTCARCYPLPFPQRILGTQDHEVPHRFCMALSWTLVLTEVTVLLTNRPDAIPPSLPVSRAHPKEAAFWSLDWQAGKCIKCLSPGAVPASLRRGWVLALTPGAPLRSGDADMHSGPSQGRRPPSSPHSGAAGCVCWTSRAGHAPWLRESHSGVVSAPTGKPRC